MDPRLDGVDAEFVEAVARRLADLIGESVAAQEPPGRIDAAEVARRLGIHRATVYRDPRRFGGEKISDGPKGRWRFDPEKIHGGGGGRPAGFGRRVETVSQEEARAKDGTRGRAENPRAEAVKCAQYQRSAPRRL